MPVLEQSLKARNTPQFDEIFKLEIKQLNPELLPLQAGLSQSSYASFENIEFVVLSVTETQNHICAKTGVFYYGLVAGCNCADDPTPDDLNNEYCELLFTIDINTAKTSITLVLEAD